VGDFPSGRGYELAQLQFDNVPSTQEITAAFYLWPGAPPSCAVKTDCGAPFGTLPNLDHGYWVINRTEGAASSYHLRVFSRGYTNAMGLSYAIVKRPTGSGAVFDFAGVCEGSPYDQANQTGRLNVPDFSEFAVAQSTQPLPAQQLILRAQVRGDDIQLAFTAEGMPPGSVQAYELRRRDNQGLWRSVATLSPENFYGQSGSALLYRWVDRDVVPQTLYLYQVVAMSADGQAKVLSNVVEAMIAHEGDLLLQVRPNPSQGTAWLIASQADLSVQVVDVQGHVVWEGRTTVGSLELPADLSAGVYVVRVADRHLRWVKLR